ncbi:fibronectin type III domain-containing protein [Persicobacter diffluens]
MRKLSHIFLMALMVLGYLPLALAQQTDTPHEADQFGVYQIQASQYAVSNAGTDLFVGEEWLVATDPVVGDYVYLDDTSDENRNETSADRYKSPSLVFKIDMPEAQKGFVWALINEGGKDKGRIYVNMNGLDLDKRAEGDYGSAAKSRISEEMAGQWQWILCNNQANDDVVKAGVNEIEIFKARPDIKIAKLAFTPQQDINMIINSPEVKVVGNDGTQLTLDLGTPSLTGELYDFNESIYPTKEYAYRVQVGEAEAVEVTEQQFTIPVSDLAAATTVSVALSHEFRKNSSSNMQTYSIPTLLSVDANSQPEDGNGSDVPHEADANGIYLFQANQYAELKEGSDAFTGENWLVGNDAEMGAILYLENTTSDNRNETSSERYISPTVVFEINMPEAQTGYVWALVNEGSKDAGRIYVNFNDLDLDKRAEGEYGSAARSRISDAMKGEWQWMLCNNQAKSEIVKQGVNKIEIFKARPNIKIAKIAFTPSQDINMIIDAPEVKVVENNGTSLKLDLGEPTLTGDLYNSSDVIYATKDFGYRVQLGENEAVEVTDRFFEIPLTDIADPTDVAVEVSHEFKANSSSEHLTYSIPTVITVDQNSLPDGEVDTEAPTIPGNLSSSEVASNSLTLSWEASTDNVAVAGYKITRDGTELPNDVTEGTSVTIGGLDPETEYTFTVRAYDAAGNHSAESEAHVVTTASLGGDGDDLPGTIHMADGDEIFEFAAAEYAANIGGKGQYDGERWLIGTDPEMGRYMYLANTDTTTNANKVSVERFDSPMLRYNISMPEASRFYIWALVNEGDVKSGTVYGSVNQIDIDKRNLDTPNDPTNPDYYGAAFGSRISEEMVGEWQWVLIGYEIRTTMLNAGINELDLFKAYPNIKIAKIALVPEQRMFPVISRPKVRIQENDGSQVIVSWEEPEVIGDFYDTDYTIFPDRNFSVRLKLEGEDEVVLDHAQGNTYAIPYASLSTAKELKIEIGHLFRRTSSESVLFYSFPSRISVSQDSQPDFEAPSIPTDLKSIDTQGTSVALSWTASTDNVGVLGYHIYQDGFIIQTVSATSYKVSGLNTSTNYTFAVSAFDAAGNESELSESISVTTRDKDDEVSDRPSVVEDLIASQISLNSFTLNWRPSNSLNGITAYYVFIREVGGGNFELAAHLNGATFSYGFLDLSSDQEYELMVLAEDGAGYVSEDSEILLVKTEKAPLSTTDEAQFMVYPNPSRGQVSVKFFNEHAVQYTVITMEGRQLMSAPIEEQKLNLDLPAGIYILNINFSNNISQSQRLVIY